MFWQKTNGAGCRFGVAVSWLLDAIQSVAPLSFVLLCAFPLSANGQPGAKIGLAVSGYRATHSDARVWTGEDYRPFLGYEVDLLQNGDGLPDMGFQIGGFYTISISDHVAVQPEVYFAERGLIFDQMELYGSAYHLEVSYLQLPLLLRYEPFLWGIRPSLLFGPQAALRLSSDRMLEVWGDRDTKDLTNVRAVDYGVVLGIGSWFDIRSQSVCLEARFEWGLAGSIAPLDEAVDLHQDPGKVNLVAMSFLVGWAP